jgi:nicotinate phosphoribosyltransferase
MAGTDDRRGPGELGLFTDLYEITMAACYFEQAMSEPATFSLFVRKLPPERSFLLAAGLEEALGFLERLRFGADAISYLRSLGFFSESFLDYLAELRFTGKVMAVAEGTIVFPDEPLLEVEAPVAEAQLAETFLLNAVQLETLIATKAARAVLASGGRRLVDFASRRAHGWDAAMKVARSSYLAGFDATSNVFAGREYGIPVAGTLAHSFVQAFEDEAEAFRAFARVFPDQTILLIDTYDTIEGARLAAEVGREMAGQGHRLAGVRLDSGDTVALSFEVRRILDEAGLSEAQILVSGSLDEYAIERARQAGAPIAGFGIGTQLGVSYDAPALDIVYKMVQYGERPVLKLSQDKQTLGGAKQCFRRFDASGQMLEDVLALRQESIEGAEPLLLPVMEGGRRLAESPRLEAIRRRAQAQLASLPERLRALRGSATYPLRHSPALAELQERLVAEHLRSQPQKRNLSRKEP